MAMIAWHASTDLAQTIAAEAVAANEVRFVEGADPRSQLQILIAAVMSAASSATPVEKAQGRFDRLELSYQVTAALDSVSAHTQISRSVGPASSSMVTQPDSGLGPRVDGGYWLWVADVNSIETLTIQHVYVPASTEDGGWVDIDGIVSAWRHLPSDWDGEDTSLPDSADFAHLERFVSLARVSGVRSPSPFIAGDGEVGLRWSEGEAFASVAFLDGGRILGYCESFEGREATRLDAFKPTNERLDQFINSLRLI